jgi:hypothetical protein
MQLPENPNRAEIRDYYETEGNPPVDCHRNHGDATPDAHGGQWVTYDPERGHFESIGTFPAVDVIGGYDGPETDQWVYYNELYFSDIVAENGEFTDRAQRTADAIHGAPDTPAGLVVNGRLTWFVAAVLDERREEHGHHGESVYEGEYADILSRLGVDPCEE